MPQVYNDPAALIRILTNTNKPNADAPGPQTHEQIGKRGEYAYDLLKNMQLQGGAYYTPTNAIADAIRGYMGGRYLDKNDQATKGAFESDALNATQGIMPQWRPPENIIPPQQGSIPSQGNVPTTTGSIVRPPVKPPVAGADDTLTDEDINIPPVEEGGDNFGKLEPIIHEVAKEQGVDPTPYMSFMKLIDQRMRRYAQPNTDLAPKPLEFNQNQTLALNNQFSDPSRQPGRASLGFDAEATLKPDNMFAAGSPLLDASPQQVGQQVGQAGSTVPKSQLNGDFLPGPPEEPTIPAIGAPGQTTIPKTSPGPGQQMPGQMPAQQTTIPKTTPAVPKPPGGIRIDANAMPQQQQVGGMIPTADAGADDAEGGQDIPQGPQSNSGQNLMQLPTNPTNQITPGMLYNILKSPTMAPEMKKMFMEQAQKQGEIQSIDVEGGKLMYNARTGQQTYVPQPIWKTESIKGISTNVMMLKPKINGPWQVFDMESGQQIDTRGGGGGRGEGGGQDSGQDSGQGGGGIERRAARARDIERKDNLAKGQTDLQISERKKHGEAGELAEKNAVVIQRLKQLENAPNINDVTTGMTAPAWNEFKKTINAWLPGTTFKEGPISLHDIYSSIATNAAASMARASDPNPSVRQFEAMLSTNPGYAQTPAGRKALLLSLEHTINLERDIGKLAKSSDDDTNPDEYNRRVQEVRQKYAKKKIIPDKLLDPKFIASKEFKNMKWMTEGDEKRLYDTLKPGDHYMDTKGNVRIKGSR